MEAHASALLKRVLVKLHEYRVEAQAWFFLVAETEAVMAVGKEEMEFLELSRRGKLASCTSVPC